MKIEIKTITKSFGKKTVLRGIDLVAESGSCVGILGSNGSGKSTLLSILAGIQKGGGDFLADGKSLFDNPKLHSKTVGYVPQGTPLIEELSARDNLLMWYDKKDLKKELSDGVLSLLHINDFLKLPVSKMSGGMKKRLSIGCAVAKKPPVLLLDEPTAALDLACKSQIGEWLARYKAEGGILLITTHDVLELEMCDAWYIIKDGRLEKFEYDGNIQHLIENL